MSENLPDLPRRPITPLPAPPGAFEAVQSRASRRKLGFASGGAATLALVLLLGVVVLPGGEMTPQQGERLDIAASSPPPLTLLDPSASPDASPSSSSSPSVSPTTIPPTEISATPALGGFPDPEGPGAEEPGTEDPSPETTEPAPVEELPDPARSSSPPPPATTYAGELQSPTRNAAPGMYVYAFSDRRDFMSARLVDRSDALGRFTAPCGGPAILVSQFPLYKASAPVLGTGYAMRFLGTSSLQLADAPPMPCTAKPEVTRLQGGSQITGELRYEHSTGGYRTYEDGKGPSFGVTCPFGDVVCAGWYSEGGRYRLNGLAPGTYRLGGMYDFVTVTVKPGQTLERDWYECMYCDDGRPAPTAEELPDPARSPSPSPSSTTPAAS